MMIPKPEMIAECSKVAICGAKRPANPLAGTFEHLLSRSSGDLFHHLGCLLLICISCHVRLCDNAANCSAVVNYSYSANLTLFHKVKTLFERCFRRYRHNA